MKAQDRNQLIEDQKRKANLVNNLAIDFEHLKIITPQVMYNKTAVDSEEFRDNCTFISELCARLEKGIADIKNIVKSIS